MLSRQLAAPMSQEERDEELEAELPVDTENRQEVFRPKVVDPSQKRKRSEKAADQAAWAICC